MSRVFLSHSKRDTELAPWFDSVFARERVDAVRFEFEFDAQAENPTVQLRQLLESSAALFVLLTPHVIGQTSHTGNWVCAEVGLARGFGKPIWVFERLDRPVQFPVPYVDHFVRLPFGTPESEQAAFRFVRNVIRSYGVAPAPTEPWEEAGHLRCSNTGCQTVFQIHQDNHEIDRCPACCTTDQWDMAGKLCVTCKGKGSVFTILPLWSACSNCNGSGWFLVDMGSGPCPTCNGQGRTLIGNQQTICGSCRGTGYQHWQHIRP